MSLLLVQPIRPDGHAEKLLLAAIIRRTAFDIALYRSSKRLARYKLWEDSYRWMMSDEDSHFTSFVSICTVLDQDPDTIRRKTMKLTRKDVRKYDMVESHGRV